MSKYTPTGVEDFSELVSTENRFLFVDKSLMIKELLEEKTKVSLIIRPRRWGKTLNMSMLRYFFAPEIKGRPTKGIFNTLKIAQAQDGAYLKHQGSHPVIFISFKTIKEASWKLFLERVVDLVSTTYTEHARILLSSQQLLENQKAIYQKILNGESTQAQIVSSLKFLSECLYTHYNQKVIILIDEYDTPLNSAYNKDYFEQVVNFFKGMFGAALKGNDALEQGVMTGILRLSKNRMLSDINNLRLYSLMEEQYSTCFGFSEEEVKALFEESDVQADMKEVQRWYNGYRSGSSEGIYNPWSILNCIKDKGALKPYWIKTGNESLLEDIFKRGNQDIDDKITRLLEGKTIEATIDEYISFDEVVSGKEEVLWSLLWTTGYLKFIEPPKLSETDEYVGLLAIPNHEVSRSYRAVFPKWHRSFNRDKYDSFLKSLVAGNVEAFVKDLEGYMVTVPSWFDFSKESNYHSFLLGLTMSLNQTHEIHSNREFGLGRPDMLMAPKNPNHSLGLILEFKREEMGKDSTVYQQLTDEGFAQINAKDYDVTLKSLPHIHQILKMCITFYGKQFVYKAAIESTEHLGTKTS